MSQSRPSLVPSDPQLQNDAAQLRQAKMGKRRRMAEEESTRSFIRMMSHELRTPLNSIIGFSEIIYQELYGPLAEPRYRQHADYIRQSGLKLLALVNQIMDIARLESGGADMDIHVQPCGGPISDAIRSVQALATERNVTLEVRIPTPEPMVFCDHRGLETALVNLLHNAITFGCDGRLVVVEVQQEGSRLAISIQDFGCGIASDQIPRLLRPFEQGENALVRHAAGAGLGLPTALLLTKAMGGTMSLSSEEGVGVRAIIRLQTSPPKPSVVKTA